MHPPRLGDALTLPALAVPVAQVVVRIFDMGHGVAAKDRRLADESPPLAVLSSAGDEPRHCRPEIERFAPDRVAGVDAAVAAVKSKFDGGDYAGALAGVQSASGAVTSAAEAAARRRQVVARLGHVPVERSLRSASGRQSCARGVQAWTWSWFKWPGAGPS